MTGLLTALTVLTAWAVLGTLFVGLLLVFKCLQSIRHWFEKITVGVRAVEHHTGDVLLNTALGLYHPTQWSRKYLLIDVLDKYVQGQGTGLVFDRWLDPAKHG